MSLAHALPAADDPLLADPPAARPIWLITLADLALLLVGFFVLVQATQAEDRAALLRGIRAGFGLTPVADAAAETAQAQMAVGNAAVRGFAPGETIFRQDIGPVADWAAAALADPRVAITITGATDGTDADVDPATGSAAVLAADRARAVATALAGRTSLPPGRVIITTSPRSHMRAVTISQQFVGEAK